MAKVNKDNLIHGVAADYVAGSGDTANITYGNLRNKLKTAKYPKGTFEVTENGTFDITNYQYVHANITGGGVIPDGYLATFKVAGEDYYMSSCKVGDSITAPPIPPLPAGMSGSFGAWQVGGADVVFPYTPNDDTTLIARWSKVPDGYTVLNYIQTTGSQYINTGIKPYNYGGLGIVVNGFTPFSYSGGYGIKFFSASDSVTSGSHSSGLSLNTSNNKLRLDFNAQNLEFIHQITYGNSYKIECGYSQSLHYAYVKMDDVIEVQNQQLNYVASNTNFQILGAFMDDPSYKFPCNARFGETIITTAPTQLNTLEGTQTLRHFIPCLDTHQVPCMYDVVAETTFYNAGSGTFQYG